MDIEVPKLLVKMHQNTMSGLKKNNKGMPLSLWDVQNL